MPMPHSRRLSGVLSWLCLLLACAPLSGCQKVMDQFNALLGDKGGDVKKTAKRTKEDPVLVKLREEALSRVQKAQARPGWTVNKEVANYRKLAAKHAKKKKLPKPTGFDWSAVCTNGGTCRVLLSFWDGRTPHQAAWLVSSSSKDIEPINCWAMSFMARTKAAMECFKKEAAKQAKQAKRAAPKTIKRLPAAGKKDDDVWDKSGNAKDIKAAIKGNTQAPTPTPARPPLPRR